MISIISASVAPSIALMLYFYLKDRYEPEPIGMVIRSFIIGALLVFPVMVIQYAFQSEGLLQGPIMESFLLSGFLEEFFKWFIVIYTVFHHVTFNEHYDGIVYTTAVSLGFACVENIFYLHAYGIHYALLRALLPVSSHGLFGVIMGYYIGKAKFSENRKGYLLLAFLFAGLLHGLYDWIFKSQTHLVYMVIPFMVFLWINAYRKIELAHHQHKLWKQKNMVKKSL